MDKTGVRQVPEGSGEQGKMEKSGCKIICGATTTLAVGGLTMMMMWLETMRMKMPIIAKLIGSELCRLILSEDPLHDLCFICFVIYLDPGVPNFTKEITFLLLMFNFFFSKFHRGQANSNFVSRRPAKRAIYAASVNSCEVVENVRSCTL